MSNHSKALDLATVYLRDCADRHAKTKQLIAALEAHDETMEGLADRYAMLVSAVERAVYALHREAMVISMAHKHIETEAAIAVHDLLNEQPNDDQP